MYEILGQIEAPQSPMRIDIKNSNNSQEGNDISYRKASEENHLIYFVPLALFVVSNKSVQYSNTLSLNN